MEALRGDSWNMNQDEHKYTIEDIFALPDGVRAELFDGEMIMMSSPATIHQRIVVRLLVEIANKIRVRDGKCEVFASPGAVFLKDDGRNYVEPDLYVVCDRTKIDVKGCHGGPDWVIEVLSPSTKKLDYGKKLAAYIEAEVREYWVVDPEKRVIVVYSLENPDMPQIHEFGDVIPVGIYEDFDLDTAVIADIE